MESVWKKNIEFSQRESLRGRIHTKAVVIGAGMAGILAAYWKIAEKLTIYEESKVVRLENNCVFTEQGMAEGEHVVFAVHYPWQVVPGYYFLQMHQERSYVIALDISEWERIEGMAAASVISEMIGGREHADEAVFAPQRFPVAALSKNFTENALQAVKGLSKQAVSMEEFPGKCPHMGCKLEENADEHTWECPCHGSCFTEKGELINGPALHGFDSCGHQAR